MDLKYNQRVIHIELPEGAEFTKKNQQVINELEYYVNRYPKVEILSVGIQSLISDWNAKYGITEENGFQTRAISAWCNYKDCQASIIFSDKLYRSAYLWGAKRTSYLYKTNVEKFKDGVAGIKRFPNWVCIERVFTHEFIHAVDSAYKLCENIQILKEYEKYEEFFIDIHEFIAECYTASEFVKENKYADKIRNIIDDIIETGI